MKYSLNWLHRQLQQNIPTDYYFFWGHTPKQQGIPDKSCLSQWYPAPFTVNGTTYQTAEHWMMVHKARLFKDEDTAVKIIAAATPAAAKKLGRTVTPFDAAAWSHAAYAIVVEGNRHKFAQHPELAAFLLRTENTVIAEASPFDPIWGIGMSKYETNPMLWKGTNLLGFALMEVRDELQTEQ